MTEGSWKWAVEDPNLQPCAQEPIGLERILPLLAALFETSGPFGLPSVLRYGDDPSVGWRRVLLSARTCLAAPRAIRAANEA